jgi:hypothetical protein
MVVLASINSQFCIVTGFGQFQLTPFTQLQ